MSRFSPQVKLWIAGDESHGAFGDGKYSLLEAIDKHGSLQEAAISLEISYRKAWGDLKKAEECLGKKLIEKHRGGEGGGRTVLTDYCRRLLKAYNGFRSSLNSDLKKQFNKYLKEVL